MLQHMSSKNHHCFDFKLFCLCKNENGYSYNFSICEGIKNSYSEHRISHDIYLVKHIISLLITVALQEEQKLCCQKVGTKLMSC